MSVRHADVVVGKELTEEAKTIHCVSRIFGDGKKASIVNKSVDILGRRIKL